MIEGENQLLQSYKLSSDPHTQVMACTYIYAHTHTLKNLNPIVISNSELRIKLHKITLFLFLQSKDPWRSLPLDIAN